MFFRFLSSFTFRLSNKLRPRARALLAAVCSRTMAHTREHEAQLRNVTDLVEAYMWLLHHVLKRRPALLAKAGIAPQPGGDSAEGAPEGVHDSLSSGQFYASFIFKDFISKREPIPD